MNSSIQNAPKLFVEITKRNPFKITSLYHSSSWIDQSKIQNPNGISVEDKNLISWTSKISNLVRRNQPIEALYLFKKMIGRGQRPNFVTAVSVMKAIGVFGSEEMRRGIHGYTIKMGFEGEIPVVTALIGTYSDGEMESVWKLFEQTVDKDVVLWSAMVSACVKCGDYVQAFKLFRAMQFCNVEPNHGSLMSVLPACAGIGSLRYGKEIHGFCIRRMFYSYSNTQNALVDMYAKCWDLKASISVFHGILVKDLISWRSIILGCVQNKNPENALSLFLEMRRFCFQPDEGIICEVIGVSSQTEKIEIGQELHGMVLRSGYLASTSMATVLLQMYANFGEVDQARLLFNELRQKDFIAWSAMISAYAQSGNPDDAFDIFRQMQLTDEKPNEVTFASLLRSCSAMAAEEVGGSIHAHVIKAGFSSNTFLISALIDMYCKYGLVKLGKAVFEDSPTADLVCWSSLINGFGRNGFGEEALECFSNMLSLGIKPNDVVFVSVLSACSHCGLEYEGWNWFYAMQENHHISPSLAHYACIVDMLSRQGNITAALDFVKDMPVEPDERIWGALLAGCRIAHESFENTEFVAKQLIRLAPNNTSYYVILSNLYAEQSRWKEVEKLRHAVDGMELKKEKGYSMI